MSKAELRAYVIAHPDDVNAVEVLADRAYSRPHPQWYQPEDLDRFSELLERDRVRKAEASPTAKSATDSL